jgi:phosphate acetyltransferase
VARRLYLVTIEPDSGKSMIALGLAEMLAHRVRRLGFFRPVVRGPNGPDSDIELIRQRFAPDLPYDALWAVSQDEAREMVADGKVDDLLGHIFLKYKELERLCDLVVCEGTDFTGLSPAFNARVANHLGCALGIVCSGRGKPAVEVVDVARAAREVFAGHGCIVAATFVNRVEPDDVVRVTRDLLESWSDDEPVYVLPEDPRLSKPTMKEVADALGARILFGEPEALSHEIREIGVAAMRVENVLERIEEHSLIITPGDRSDVILAALATVNSESGPSIAGLVLTGGIEPDPTVRRLIEGSRWASVPILSVQTETYDTALALRSLRAELTPDNKRKIAAALGVFESRVDTAALAARIEVARSDLVTPLMFEYELLERARKRRQHIVLAEGEDERALRAGEILLSRQAVDLTLLGDEHEINTKISGLGLDLPGAVIVNPAHSEMLEDYARGYHELRQAKGMTEEVARETLLDVSYFGTMMVHTGAADGMVSGAVHTTAHTVRPALEFVRTREGVSLVSSVFFMCLPDRVLVYGDCAVNPNPDAGELAEIALCSAATAELFGIEPRVAMLSYSTGESAGGEEVDKVREATRIARQRRPDLPLDGPMQYDAAVDPEVARAKMPSSEIAGRATVFIFPDLGAGNNTYKAVQRSAGAIAIGPILQGLRRPVNDLSRGCTVADIVNVVAITAVQAQAAGSAAG